MPKQPERAGVVYSPPEIVDHILARTLAAALRGRTRDEVADLKLLDPACGAGAILVGACRVLMRWHAEQGRGTLGDRLDVLRDNLFGVDVDVRAVARTRQALLDCALEGQTDLVKRDTRVLARARAPLEANIRCGDALVEDVFDWREVFGAVFERPEPGFDVVVGNPPYLDSGWMSVHGADLRRWCAEHYTTARGNWDLYCVFVERSLQLLRRDGLHAFVVPNKIASAPYARPTRRLMTGDHTLLQVRDYSGTSVFPEGIYPLVYVLRQGTRTDSVDRAAVLLERMRRCEGGYEIAEAVELPYTSHFPADGSVWRIFGTLGQASAVLERFSHLPTLGEVAEVHGGATVSEAYDLPALITSRELPDAGDLRILNSGTIDRYRSLWGRRPMRYLREDHAFPVVEGSAQSELPPRRLEQARTPKVIVAGMTKVLECVADEEGAVLAAKSTTIVVPRDKMPVAYLAGLLNSLLVNLVYRAHFGGLALASGYLRVAPPQLRDLPIPLPRTACEEALADELCDCARQLAAVHRDPGVGGDDGEELSQRIEDLEARIDDAVYSLYGLTEEERALLSKEPG